jgi:response regulator RpfG family c-di-GMP phosphodiesterase
MNELVTILYVDDEPINLEMFKMNISNHFKVLTSESAIGGLEILQKYPDIKVIISDMRMPQMNGIEFIKEVRKINKIISCFILTGYGINDEIQKALESGLIISYFQKPFNMRDIETKISEVLLKKG